MTLRSTITAAASLLALALLTAAPLATAVASKPVAEAPAGLAAQIQGEWTVVLSDEEKKQLAAMQLAFRDPPPTESEMATLSDEEKMLVGIMMMARESDPDGAQVAEMKSVMANMDKMKLVITADSLTMAMGEHAETAAWKAKSESAAGLVIVTTTNEGVSEELTVAVDGDTLTLTGAPDREGAPPKVMRFSR